MPPRDRFPTLALRTPLATSYIGDAPSIRRIEAACPAAWRKDEFELSFEAVLDRRRSMVMVLSSTLAGCEWTVAEGVDPDLGTTETSRETRSRHHEPRGHDGQRRLPSTPRESHVAALKASGLGQQARAWAGHAERLLERAVPIVMPEREVVYFGHAVEEGVAYALDVEQGRRLRIAVERSDEGAPEPFVDLFFAPEDEAPRHVEGGRVSTLEHFVERSGRYLLRIQPPLFGQGRYAVSFVHEPSLVFPVEGKDRRAVQSFFGAPRAGGTREHHGIDIFADRRTPALAAADGMIVRVGVNRLGGNVVWLRDAQERFIAYYAHLERALVRPGDLVKAGDPLGEVGNSGNARYGAPHLHFGLYRRGPMDPLPFVDRARNRLPDVPGALEVLGREHRVARGRARLRDAPGRGEVLTMLRRDEVVWPFAWREGWVRVRTLEGREGWMLPRVLAPAAD